MIAGGDLDVMLGELEAGTKSVKETLHQNGSTSFNPAVSANSSAPEAFGEYEQRVDALFNGKVAYQAIKRERPEHRLMLWMKLNGNKTRDIALQLGYTEVHVRTVCKQPWFLDAFVRLSSETGKDAVQTFLKGEVMPALARTVEIANTAEKTETRLAANKEILDRFLGKSVVKAEVKSSGTVDVTVRDITKLLDEQKDLDRQLAANGLLTSTRN